MSVFLLKFNVSNSASFNIRKINLNFIFTSAKKHVQCTIKTLQRQFELWQT